MHMRASCDDDIEGSPEPEPGPVPRFTVDPIQGLYLDKPVVIPQRVSGQGMPFCRAYTPLLGKYGLTEQPFLGFLDTLNLVNTPQCDVHLLRSVSESLMGIGDELYRLIGTGIQETIKQGERSVDYFLNNMNQTLFQPRKLQVKLVPTTDLIRELGLTERPLMPELTEDQYKLSVQERRMDGIKRHACPIKFDVSPPTQALRDILDAVLSSSTEESDLLRARQEMIDSLNGGSHFQYMIESAQSDEERARWQALWGDHKQPVDREQQIVESINWLIVRPA